MIKGTVATNMLGRMVEPGGVCVVQDRSQYSPDASLAGIASHVGATMKRVWKGAIRGEVVNVYLDPSGEPTYTVAGNNGAMLELSGCVLRLSEHEPVSAHVCDETCHHYT